MIKARVAALMDKEMDRKSFLIHVAASVVALVGASAAFRALSGGSADSSSRIGASNQAYGYGDSPYGR